MINIRKLSMEWFHRYDNCNNREFFSSVLYLEIVLWSGEVINVVNCGKKYVQYSKLFSFSFNYNLINS